VIFTLDDDDNGNVSLTLDDEGIEHLIGGLEQLRNAKPEEYVDSPMLGEDGVGYFILVKA